MSRVMRRTPYDAVRFSLRKLADGTYGRVAVTPCDKCAPWKVRVCKGCPTATSKEIEMNIKRKLAFVHNMGEDKWHQKVWCKVKHEYTFDPIEVSA